MFTQLGKFKIHTVKIAVPKISIKKLIAFLSGTLFLSLKTSCVSVNASYCRALCAEHRARLPTISDFNATDHVIKNFAFPGGSVQKLSLDKQYVPVRKGFSLKISYRASTLKSSEGFLRVLGRINYLKLMST